jgi:hypothetical protein
MPPPSTFGLGKYRLNMWKGEVKVGVIKSAEYHIKKVTLEQSQRATLFLLRNIAP